MTPHLTSCERGCGSLHIWRTAGQLAKARASHKCAPLPYVPKHMKRRKATA